MFHKAVRAGEVTLCWARYLRWGKRRAVPGLVDFVVGNHFFRAQQNPAEFSRLAEIVAARSPQRVLEIGTALGGTLFFITHAAHPSATILSVDLPGGKFGGGYGPVRRWIYEHFARPGQRLRLFRGDSHSDEILESVKMALERHPLDYLFIDGDHTYSGVKQDFERFAPLVRKGGMVVLHDIAQHPLDSGCEVSRFWNEVKAQYLHLEIINDPQQGGYGLGVLYVE